MPTVWGGAWESAFLTSPQDDACARDELPAWGGLWQASHQTIGRGCSVSEGPGVAGRSPHRDLPSPPASRFAKYYKMENGSEYRTLLKAFGIRFDVLVYGNVSPRLGRWVDRGGNSDPTWALKSLLRGQVSAHRPALGTPLVLSCLLTGP